MDKIKIGIVADFQNYEDYFRRFYEKYGSNVIELHILRKDFDKVMEFAEKLNEVKEFIVKNEIKDVAFHSPDGVMQSVLFDEKSIQFEEDKGVYYLMLDELKKLSNELKQEIVLVVHQGIRVPRDRFRNMGEREIDRYRENILEKARKSYEMLMKYTKGSRLVPMLENSPPFCASEPSEHFIDLAFEELKERIGSNGFVFDFSHAAMCVEYFRQREQNKEKCAGLESVRRKFNGVPESLKLMESYIKMAGKNIRWMHISDANGIMGKNEGLAVGAEGSLIDFKNVFDVVEKEVAKPRGVLEIVNGHRDFNLIEESMDKIQLVGGV